MPTNAARKTSARAVEDVLEVEVEDALAEIMDVVVDAADFVHYANE